MSAPTVASLVIAGGLLLAFGGGCVAGEEGAAAGADGLLREAADVQVAAAPFLVIEGTDDGDSFNLFAVSDAVLLPDGRLVVANAGEYELLVFDAQGRFSQRLGNKGEGPGEFSAGLTPRLFVTEDELLATSGVGRVNRYALPSLELTATERLVGEGSGTRAALVGAFADGSFLLASYPIEAPDSTPVPELRQPSKNLVRILELADSGTRLATVREVARYTHNSGPITSHVGVPLYGRDLFAVSGSMLVVVPTDSGTIRYVGADGALQRVLRWKVEQAHAKDAWKSYAAGAEQRVGDLPPPLKAHALSFYDVEIPMPDMAAVYGSVMADATGVVWLRRIDWSTTESNSWDVVDPDRRTISRVELPSGVYPQFITEGTLVGLAEDSLGVERVVLYGIRRSLQ